MLERALDQELPKYLAKSYTEWLEMQLPIRYDLDGPRERCQIEIDELERKEQYIHIMISASDGYPSRYLLWIIPIWSPRTLSVIFYKDGRIDAGAQRAD